MTGSTVMTGSTRCLNAFHALPPRPAVRCSDVRPAVVAMTGSTVTTGSTHCLMLSTRCRPPGAGAMP